MEVVKEFFQKIDEFVMQYWGHVDGFLGKGWYIIYAGILAIVALLTLVGLITVLIKFKKIFLPLLIIIGIFCAASYFFIYK